MRTFEKRLPIKLNRIRKPWSKPKKKPGGSKVSGLGWVAHPARTAIATNVKKQSARRYLDHLSFLIVALPVREARPLAPLSQSSDAYRLVDPINFHFVPRT